MKFHLSDVLSVTTGSMLSQKGIGGVYEILNYMTGDNLYTHQLTRALEECRPWLIRWYPILDKVDSSSIRDFIDAASNPVDGCAWFVSSVSKSTGLPMELEVWPIPRDDHDNKDPIQELVGIVGKEQVIVVEMPGDE